MRHPTATARFVTPKGPAANMAPATDAFCFWEMCIYLGFLDVSLAARPRADKLVFINAEEPFHFSCIIRFALETGFRGEW